MGHRSEARKTYDRMSKASCGSKKKYKSSEASKVAHKYGQRKYECEICGGFHLTKQVDK